MNVPAVPAASAAPVSLFYSYAHEDEGLRDELQGHLKILERRGLLAPWHDRRIEAGQDWGGEIDSHLRSAELVLLLVSKDFIESDYIMGIELRAAMQRHAEARAVVVPIVVRAVDLDPDDADALPFLKLQGLPTGLRPVTSWPNRDEAWTDVAKGLRATVKGIRERRPPVEPPAPRVRPAPASTAPRQVPADRLPDDFDPFFADTGAPAGAASSPSSDLLGGLFGGSPAAPAARPDTPARADPVLDRVVADVTLQIDQAQRERQQPPLDPIGLAAVQAGTRALIDLPEQKRVLWVDDQPANNRYVAAALAKLQIEVVTALSTDEALRCIAADREGFDLVISDWERVGEPPQAGLLLLERLRRLGQPVPVVYYHAAFGERRGERTAQALMAGAFGEAVRPADLMALVEKALDG